jgi:hypothetical protein
MGLLVASPSHASLGKWFKNEVVPTVTGKRPLKIEPGKVKITENGKRLLDLDMGKDTLYVDLGVARFKTAHLREDLLKAGAVMAGDTAVIDAIVVDQLKQKLQPLLAEKEVTVSNKPPKVMEEIAPATRRVVIFNPTSEPIRYAMNQRYYVLPPQTGASHQAADFFMQLDAFPGGGQKVNIRRYSLKGDEYYLWVEEGSNEITINRIE